MSDMSPARRPQPVEEDHTHGPATAHDPEQKHEREAGTAHHGAHPVSPVKTEALQPVRRSQVRSLPKVTVHDTIFSDIPKQSSFDTEHVRVVAERAKNRKIALLGAAALVIIVAVILTIFVLPKANIAVYPKAENVNRDLEISLATTTTQADINTLSLPASSIDETREVQDKFQATGKKELGSKATGKVRVYNLTGASINLKAATTTLSANGKTFVFSGDQNYIKAVTPKAVTSPTSGHVATIVASEGGEASNLPAGTRLEITNQVFGNKPQLLYAVVDDGLVGGNSRFVSVVSAEDITKAQATLTAQVVSDINAKLKDSGKLLAEKAYTAEAISFSTDKAQDAESPVFTARLNVRLKGLAFDAVALTDLVRGRVLQVLPKGDHLQPSQKDALTFRVRQIDPTAGTMRLVVHFESKLYKDLAAAAGPLVGMSRQDVENYFSATGKVDHVDISLWPSYQTSMPRMVSRISVSIKQE
jgi:hypothetical protein